MASEFKFGDLVVKSKKPAAHPTLTEQWHQDYLNASNVKFGPVYGLESAPKLPETMPEMAFCLDNSGSMAGARERQLKLLLQRLVQQSTQLNLRFYAFGQGKKQDSRFFNEPLGEALISKLRFDSGTYPDAIGGAIDDASRRGKVVLFVYGDGQFSASFAQILENTNLDNVESVVVLFPYDTSSYIVNDLTKSLTSVIEQAPHPISFRVVPPIPEANLDALYDEIQRESKLYAQVPDDCAHAWGLAWSKDMPNKDLAAAIRQAGNGASICRHWCEQFMKTLQHCPQVLEHEGGPYATVYDVIKRLRGGLVSPEDPASPERVISFVATFRLRYKALDAVIAGSQGDDRVLRAQLCTLSPKKYKCAPILATVAQNMVRDQSGAEWKKALPVMLTSAEFVEDNGMPIPSKSRCEAVGKPFAQACLEALKFFLAAAGSRVVLEGSTLFVGVLMLLCDVGDDGLVIPHSVHHMCEVALENNPDWVKKSLGLNASMTELNDMPKWSSSLLSCLLYKAFKMYPHVFPVDSGMVTFFETRYRLIVKLATLSKIRDDQVTVERLVTSTGVKGDCSLLGEGDLCVLLKSAGDPPKVVVYLGVCKRGGHKYLHFKYVRGGNTVRIRHRRDVQLLVRAPCIPDQAQYLRDVKRVVVLDKLHAKVPSFDLNRCFEYKACMSRIQKYEKHRVPTPEEKAAHAAFCAGSACAASQAELDAYLGTKTEVQTIAVPARVIQDVIVSRDVQLDKALQAKSLGFMEQLKAGMAADAAESAVDGSAVEFAGGGEMVVRLSASEEQCCVDYFKSLSAPPAVASGSLTARTCVSCMEPRRPQDCEAMCAKGGKSHFACKECLKRCTPTEMPKPGEVVSLTPYRCFVCREFRPVLPAHIQPLTAQQPDGQEFRVCAHPGCGRIFGYHPQCGGGGCADTCGAHDLQTFECPKCHIRLQHAGGCRLIRCCPRGYHGCGQDRGEACEHRVCFCESAVCGHDKGCGHTFFIEQAN